MRQNRIGKVLVFLAAPLLALPLAANQAPPAEASLARKVENAILKSPRYGPFDLISFEVKGDTVTLGGSVYRATLRQEAEKSIAAVPGVARVVNSIEILPVSLVDDRLRRAVFVSIYRDNFLSKYGSPAATLGVGTWGRGFAGAGFGGRALDFEPPGKYSIHVVVKGGRVTLYGRVDNDVDRHRAALDAWGVFGVMAIDNRIEVLPRRQTA